MRRLITALVAIVMAVALAACGALDEGSGDTKGTVKAKKGSTVVKVGYLHTIAVDDKLWLGQVAGYWAKQGLDLKLTKFDTGIAEAQALNAGSIDVAIMGGVTSNFPAQGQGKVFMLNSIENATAQIWVQPGSEITNVKQLKGKKVVTTTGTTADILLLRALTKAGVSRSDVTVVNAAMPDAVQAFNSGSVDAIVLWVPFDLRVKEADPGASMIASAGDYPDAAVGDGWVANNAWYAKHQATVKKIVAGWLQSNAAFRKDPSGSLQKVWKVAYSQDAKLSDLQHQVKYQTDYTNAEWLQRYENGQVLDVVGTAEKAFVALGGLPSFVEPKTFFDTSLFVDVAKQAS
ncbi:ABC transporter substrate-binding protein [Nocardioides mangrovicus]|uniref:ABC transporter substrate-binding protein n=1 Tax=Nocardioides mangrovicus TaxID=2478913 RepID=A0A3L8P659_9ACTN|nr:ABC transporter substrate-binding protein [Nocardioides mangrovicus]RLV50427.1 ABC transporter substrate-binding protein [Nocardioides mangrovicus]